MKEIRPVPEAYLTGCDPGGRLEELPVPGYSPALVYLPEEYDATEKRYSTLYLLHGGGGDSRSYFREDGLLKNLLDHMIAAGETDPLIVITPTYYPPGRSGDGIAYSEAAVREFGPVLVREILPRADAAYRTVRDRMNRAIGGCHMGAVTTWFAFMAGMEDFRWFLPISGDCWICGERGGGRHPVQTASLLSDSARGRDFYLHVYACTEDRAYPNLDPQMRAMMEQGDAFGFGKKTRYSVLEGGFDDAAVRRVLYSALPELFREDRRK